jgi:hypothetical protein
MEHSCHPCLLPHSTHSKEMSPICLLLWVLHTQAEDFCWSNVDAHQHAQQYQKIFWKLNSVCPTLPEPIKVRIRKQFQYWSLTEIPNLTDLSGCSSFLSTRHTGSNEKTQPCNLEKPKRKQDHKKEQKEGGKKKPKKKRGRKKSLMKLQRNLHNNNLR